MLLLQKVFPFLSVLFTADSSTYGPPKPDKSEHEVKRLAGANENLIAGFAFQKTIDIFYFTMFKLRNIDFRLKTQDFLLFK